MLNFNVGQHGFMSRVFLPIACFCSINGADVLASAPKWELGVGAASYVAPHYLGANQSAAYVLPVPFVIYRGDRLNASRDGIFGRLYDEKGISLRLSLSGSLPVDNKDNEARAGMPDLDLLLEAGPTLQMHLWKADAQEWRLDLPARVAFSVGSHVREQGFVFNPRLHYQHDWNNWRFKSTFGPVYGSESYHDYFYQVDKAYVTADRSYFDSAGGLTGIRMSLGLNRRWGEFYGGASVHYYQLDSAANQESPLMKSNDYLSVSFMLVWVFLSSSEMTEID